MTKRRRKGRRKGWEEKRGELIGFGTTALIVLTSSGASKGESGRGAYNCAFDGAVTHCRRE